MSHLPAIVIVCVTAPVALTPVGATNALPVTVRDPTEPVAETPVTDAVAAPVAVGADVNPVAELPCNGCCSPCCDGWSGDLSCTRNARDRLIWISVNRSDAA